MPKAYCCCCGKQTAHKMVMKRVQTQPEGWQGFQQFLTMLMQGQHYYQMEQQYFCRVCNQQNERVKQHDRLAGARVS
ncbi:hypothetical protein [Vibrio mimicus]|uniref:hypothetical protein n=1 Tax=Vibrio mimicus TaxID=674 RepID=UPI0011DA3CF1|nr:hypothetical protein [Vibrio mimicus]TXY44433.1 hypothetical protein FXE78_19135 [Vibrio mimicus]TXZ75386.1 hypothetical protein FXE51_10745 [Vibrio mimicus]